MNAIFGFVQAHSFWSAVVAYWLFSNAVGSMPAPNGSSGKGYLWLYKFLQGLAGNLSSAFAAKIPGVGEKK